tara:strand:+ start:6624 stop:6803 length:180 start_codon:yes stop_codon:yes gene_type:complete
MIVVNYFFGGFIQSKYIDTHSKKKKPPIVNGNDAHLLLGFDLALNMEVMMPRPRGSQIS